MQFDTNDIMWIEAPRHGSFAIKDHHPLVAGRLPDGREAYIFDLNGEDKPKYYGSGPTSEEVRFMERRSGGSLIFASPCSSDELYVRVLRYDPEAYVHCEYYANKKRSEEASGLDSTGPFSWKFVKYLPDFRRRRSSTNCGSGSLELPGDGHFPENVSDEERH